VAIPLHLFAPTATHPAPVSLGLSPNLIPTITHSSAKPPVLACSLLVQHRAVLGSRAPKPVDGFALEGRCAGGWWRSDVLAGVAALVERKAEQVSVGLPVQQVNGPLLATRTSWKRR
jgi:hypothetical protein